MMYTTLKYTGNIKGCLYKHIKRYRVLLSENTHVPKIQNAMISQIWIMVTLRLIIMIIIALMSGNISLEMFQNSQRKYKTTPFTANEANTYTNLPKKFMFGFLFFKRFVWARQSCRD